MFFTQPPQENGLIWRFLFLCMHQYDLCLRKTHKLRLATLGELQRFSVIFVLAHCPVHVQRPTWISVHVPIMLYACVRLCLRPDHPSVCSMYVMQCIIQHPASGSYLCPYTSTLVYPSLWLQSIFSCVLMNLEGMLQAQPCYEDTEFIQVSSKWGRFPVFLLLTLHLCGVI